METKACFSKKPIWALLFLLLALAATSVHGQGTRVGFYSTTCPNAETIVTSTVRSHFESNARIAPGLLRLSFHDCFIRGCDGSVLIAGTDTERNAIQNRNIPGYNVIDDAKSQLEAACPGVVSCADILQLAARDSVVETGGSSWEVPTGRRDGNISVESDATTLPDRREVVSSQLDKFLNIGLNTQDLVTLVGSHTIGTTTCPLFNFRLFDFPNSTTGADPTIAPDFLPILRGFCPQGETPTTRIELDNGSGSTFDISYFTNLQNSRGILESDQFLWNNTETRPVIESFLSGALNFNTEFGRSMIKMSNIDVLTGTNGEIRTVCSAIN